MTARQVALGELFVIGSSKRVMKSQWKSEGVPFYRGREITRLAADGFVENELFISEEDYAEYSSKYGVPKAGDIVITAIGTIGNTYVVQDKDRFYFKDASVLWLKKNSPISSEFMNLWFQSPHFFDQLERGNGATVDTLTIQKLQGLIVDLPDLEGQRRVVSILDEAFDGIATAKANAEKNLQNACAVFENYLESVFSSRDGRWIERRLGDIAKTQYGLSEPMNEDGKGFKIFRMGEVQDGRLIDTGRMKFANIDEAEFEKYRLQPGDVLFNRTNSFELVGKTGIFALSGDYCFASYLVRVLLDKKIMMSEFLNYLMNSAGFQDSVKKKASKSINQANINATILANEKVRFPESLKEQKSVVSRLNSLREETRKLESIYQRKLAALDELKQSLLHQAFSGAL